MWGRAWFECDYVGDLIVKANLNFIITCFTWKSDLFETHFIIIFSPG